MLFLFLLFLFFIIHLSYSLNINGKTNLFINTSYDNNNNNNKKKEKKWNSKIIKRDAIQISNVMNMRNTKKTQSSKNMRNIKQVQNFYEPINKKERDIYPKIYNAQIKNNVIYKQIPELTYPYKKYNIDDIYYGRILSINSKKIKLDILCDRKAYLNTSEYFNNRMMNKYIYNILNINNIIKVQIKNIEKIHQKIHVDIKKYTYEEFVSSFKNNNIYINSKVIQIKPNYALLYLAPKVIGKLRYDKNQDMRNFHLGNNVHVKIDYFDKMKNELYVIR
ncbi:conserved Plasmodium protein, unknown function [Plasmodium reichenowi]|uniref:S1 motif domain-containing protein n=1 Tax=Plasmodium reichenowi TaxID=5854 RepID=A0A2P9D1L1_PLARE|nr:conserved Plasmodium protein, unknown function [Plasmodium reichenowi]